MKGELNYFYLHLHLIVVTAYYDGDRFLTIQDGVRKVSQLRCYVQII